MARQVRHDEQRPEVFDKSDLGDDGKLYICRCGLSSKGALCDGSHNATSDEGKKVYKYENDDPDGQRRAIEGFEFTEE
ncbi:MAG: CDGSH iron-sulfur domain-containing protein [Natronomonas sp.]